MKKLVFLLLCGLVLQVTAQSTVSTKEWQDDLRFLQSTIHTDYSFLFKKTTATDFDKAVDELYKAIPNLEEHEIIVGFARIVSSFKYGHTVLGFRNLSGKFHQLPLNLYHFNDGVYVQGVHKDYEKALGAKVIAIAGMPIEAALKAIYPVVPAENDQFVKAYGFKYLISPERKVRASSSYSVPCRVTKKSRLNTDWCNNKEIGWMRETEVKHPCI